MSSTVSPRPISSAAKAARLVALLVAVVPSASTPAWAFRSEIAGRRPPPRSIPTPRIGVRAGRGSPRHPSAPGEDRSPPVRMAFEREGHSGVSGSGGSSPPVPEKEYRSRGSRERAIVAEISDRRDPSSASTSTAVAGRTRGGGGDAEIPGPSPDARRGGTSRRVSIRAGRRPQGAHDKRFDRGIYGLRATSSTRGTSEEAGRTPDLGFEC